MRSQKARFQKLLFSCTFLEASWQNNAVDDSDDDVRKGWEIKEMCLKYFKLEWRISSTTTKRYPPTCRYGRARETFLVPGGLSC